MDIATHALVPYAAALAALGAWRAEASRKRTAWSLVFGVAGAAPDLDGGLDWLSHWDADLYFLQHRGISHTLVGAPLFGLVVLGALVLLARRWPGRFGLFAFRPALLAAAILGSWTHLVLDYVTYAGVPLFWPFASGRVSLFLFQWLVPWLFPVSAVILLVPVVKRWRPYARPVALAGGALVVAAVLVLAGIRIVQRPDLPGAVVYPRNNEAEWLVMEPAGRDSWTASLLKHGERYGEERYVGSPTGAPESALAAARKTSDFKGFEMGSFGPQIIQAHPDGDGWNVTFLNVAQRYEATHGARYTPAQPRDSWGMMAFHVHHDGRVDAVVRGW